MSFNYIWVVKNAAGYQPGQVMPSTADGSHWQAPNMNVHNAYYTRYHRGHLSSLVISSHLRDYDCCAVIYGRLTFSRGVACHVIVSELETICGQQSFVSRLQLISRDSSEPSRDREKETAAASYLSDNLTASRPLPVLPSSPQPQPSSPGRRKTLDKTFFRFLGRDPLRLGGIRNWSPIRPNGSSVPRLSMVKS